MTLHDLFKTMGLDGSLAALNVGSTDPGADFQLLTAADVLIASLQMSNPAFQPSTMQSNLAVAVSGSISPETSPLNDVTIGKFRWQNRANTVIVEGTVSGPSGGGNLIIDDVVVPPDTTEIQFNQVVATAAYN